jgi:cold shock CspA family protein
VQQGVVDMISRRGLLNVLKGGSAAAIVPASAQANPSLVDWEEPEWDDSDRPEGGGAWHVKWFNRARGFGFVRNDAGEEMRVNKDTLKASGISLSEMRPGRSFVVRWKRDGATKIAMNLQRR